MRNTRFGSAVVILTTKPLDAAAIRLRYGGKPGQAVVYKITMKGDTNVFAGQRQQR